MINNGWKVSEEDAKDQANRQPEGKEMIEFPLPKIERYVINDHEVHVVRDDLSFPFPLPNNSKIRGVARKLQNLKEKGIKTVISQDTSISRCGWAVSYVCKQLDMKHFNIVSDRKDLTFYQRMSASFGGVLVPVHGSYSSAMFAQGKKVIEKVNTNAYPLTIGLSFPESLQEHIELIHTLNSEHSLDWGSLVVSVSSGTIVAGILSGILSEKLDTRVYGILSSSFKNRKAKILDKLKWVGLKNIDTNVLSVNDMGYKYKDSEKEHPPFPCDIFLDRKAWKFLLNNLESLPEPVVFWNIGGEWSPEVGLTKDLVGDGIVTQSKIDQHLKDAPTTIKLRKFRNNRLEMFI